jgi:hypothetical protein
MEIPDSVTAIGDHAFSECRSLSILKIGNGVTSIGDFAISDCSNLTEIFIPDNVTHLGIGVFLSTQHLTVYCEASDKPRDWPEDWDQWGIESNPYTKVKVVWNSRGN